MKHSGHNTVFAPAGELGQMLGFTPARAKEDCMSVPLDRSGDISGDTQMSRLSEFCDAWRHPLLQGTLYISRINPREWFVELDQVPLTFKGDSDQNLLDTLANIMPRGEA